jgi:hypothetical protein
VRQAGNDELRQREQRIAVAGLSEGKMSGEGLGQEVKVPVK